VERYQAERISEEAKMAGQALEGLKVVECGEFISAAYCAKMMADLGAEVIKIEETGTGDEARRYGPFPDDIPHPEKSGLFLYLNGNKLGITLNMRTAMGRSILKGLLRDTDIFVENNPPQLMKDLGLDYTSLKEVNPRLIMTSITPYGQTGPYKDYKAYDLNIQAAGGLCNTVGNPERRPINFPIMQGYYQAALSAAAATMVALFARETTSRGQQVDISATQVCAALHRAYTMPTYFKGAHQLRLGNHGQPGLWPYTVLPCKDGYMSMMTLEDYHWKMFAEAIGNPEWALKYDTPGERYENKDEMDAYLIEWLMNHTKQEVFDLCFERRIPFVPEYNTQDLMKSAQFKERQYLVEIEHPETGVLKYPGAPAKLSKTPWRIDRPAPLLGEHNEEVYCKHLGYSHEDLVELRRAGVI